MKNKKLIIGLIAVVAVIAILLGVYFATRPQTQAGMKEFTVIVVHGDGTTAEFTHATEQETLGRALVEMGLVEDNQGPYGLTLRKWTASGPSGRRTEPGGASISARNPPPPALTRSP